MNCKSKPFKKYCNQPLMREIRNIAGNTKFYPHKVSCFVDILPRTQLECWRKFVLACRRLVQYSLSSDDITIADGLLLKFCKRSAEIYGDDAITPNMHMHCHLASCLREFGLVHSFWLFPFERYNGILEDQPTNNRSVEMQLMKRFQRDNLHIHMQHEAHQWPEAELFLEALPAPSYDILSPVIFEKSVIPGPKSVIDCLSPDMVQCLCKLYCKLYPSNQQLFSEGQIFIPSTFKKYSTVKWHGKNLVSALNKYAKNCYVFVAPPFPFTSCNECNGKERLAMIEYFLLHTVSMPDVSEPKSHIFACLKWPMVHPERDYFGKPVEVWCRSVYEPQPLNKFCLVSDISSRAIISVDSTSVYGESVLVAIPIIE